jgi:hypothetical protein
MIGAGPCRNQSDAGRLLLANCASPRVVFEILWTFTPSAGYPTSGPTRREIAASPKRLRVRADDPFRDKAILWPIPSRSPRRALQHASPF